MGFIVRLNHCLQSLVTCVLVSTCFTRALLIHDTTSRQNQTAQELFPEFPAGASEKHQRWADAAFRYVHGLKCKDVFFTTERECRYLVRLRKSDVNIYIADPPVYGRVMAVLPDAGLSRAGFHDAVVVVDPYPEANFGHLVIVFYMDFGMSEGVCHRESGIYLGHGECMTLALKKRCKNALARRGRRRNFARRCEINFLPRVYLETDMETKQQLLRCLSNLRGFALCPHLRPINETSNLICNPVRDNTKRCETTHEVLHTSCRVFEICDQAVILSGGWNRFSTLPRHKQNVQDVYHMLRKNGFKRRNIKIFFANGANGIEVEGERHHEVYPSAMKLAMRYHLQKMCMSPHCVDSLVFYMNSPSRSDGTSLLWDVNNDGVASEAERYTVEEILEDLKNCAARQVHVIVDQSYAGEIARAVRRSKHHNNVIVFASSRDHEYSWGSTYTQHWVNFNHTHTCSRAVHKAVKGKIRNSSPEMQEGEHGVVSTTIFGAPCDVIPPFTHKELRQNYLGCQNLPTALWLIKLLDSSNTDSKNKHQRKGPNQPHL